MWAQLIKTRLKPGKEDELERVYQQLQATEQPGSWWRDWRAWLAPHGGARIPAPLKLGSEGHARIEPAPGRYVREKAQ